VHHPIVSLRNVSFSYGHGAILDRVSLDIPEGAFIGVVGPSGAGKTTLLRLIAGALHPSSGEVVSGDGKRPVRLATVPQIETIDWHFPVTVEEVVLLGTAADRRILPWSTKEQRARVGGILEKLGIGGLGRRHIRELSGGQQQRVFLARALMRDPELILLDEPTAGVDVKTRHDIIHLLHTLNHDGIAIVLTTHDLSAVAAHLPSLVCVNRRLIASGKPAEVLTADVLRELYGADMIVIEEQGMLLIGDVPSAFQERHPREEHPSDLPAAHFGDQPPPHTHDHADHDHAEGA
jgi:zinc/manganese transport system ATP-binding protein/zinc transport system ATP-binding protein